MHLSDIKNVGFEEFVERLTSFRNGSQEFLEVHIIIINNFDYMH